MSRIVNVDGIEIDMEGILQDNAFITKKSVKSKMHKERKDGRGHADNITIFADDQPDFLGVDVYHSVGFQKIMSLTGGNVKEATHRIIIASIKQIEEVD